MNSTSDNSNLKEVLERFGVVSLKPKGVSMLPFIVAGRDTVVLKTPENLPYKKGSCVLFERKDGSFVLHRVKKITESIVITIGDNVAKCDPPLKKEQILAVMEGYYKKGKYVDASSKSYNFWVKVWCFLPVKIVGRVFIKIVRVFKKMLKK